MSLELQYEFFFKGTLVRPGTSIRVKNVKHPVVYECMIYNNETDKAHVIVIDGKERRKVPLGFVVGVVILKRSRAKCQQN